MSTTLASYGWNLFASQNDLDPEDSGNVGRVTSAGGGFYQLMTALGEAGGVLAGRLRHLAFTEEDSGELPAVGDWVTLAPRASPEDMAVIEGVLERRTRLSRKTAGSRAVEQVVAANVDVVLVVMGLDGDWSPRRLERYLVMTWDSGARPVAVLNKADLLDAAELGERRAEISGVAPGVPVLVTSFAEGRGVAEVVAEVRPGETAALVGSSGVGKSTLINRLAGGDVQATRAVRERDERGQHTTTRRELFLLPGGALLIDNPGIRELQLWTSGDGLGEAFRDVEAAAAGCRFRDCSHGGEPGCAVAAAVEAGTLAAERLASFHALRREQESVELRQDERARRASERSFGRMVRNVMAEKKKTRY